MPTYEYVCEKCHHELEAFQSMKDEPLKRCPACRRLTLRRRIGGGSGLIFKGTGFYITDYRKQPAPGAAAANGDKAPAKAAPAKPAEAKPAKAAAS